MKLIVTGACGYKGNVLVPKLLNAGHHVTALDIMWFGNDLQDHPNLEVRQFDVREPEDLDLHGYDAIIHLSSVANDPCGDLDPKLTWEVSCLATMRLADKAVRQGVKRFIYASSGSVYGLKDEEHVTEDLELVPLSEYNKTKMVAERVLMSYSEQMKVQIVRPATVCGLSPRMRLDVAVNMLAMQALTKGAITVLGGEQTRPNIHVDDITDLYIFLLDRPDVLGIYNAGFENISILTIAEMVKKRLGGIEIKITESNDPRSYRQNSDKLLSTGFTQKHNVEEAIKDLTEVYNRGELDQGDHCFTVKWMKHLNLDIK